MSDLLEKISKLPLDELIKLKKGLQEQFGIDDSALAATVQTSAGPAAAEAKSEDISYTVVLTGYDNKIGAIKWLKEHLSLDLKPAKDAIEGLEATKEFPLKQGLDKGQADELVKKAKESGLVCQLKEE